MDEHIFDKVQEVDMQKTMENLGSCCPSVNALVHIAIPLPCHEQELKKIEYFSLAKTQKILF